jgi:hypothetical protein
MTIATSRYLSDPTTCKSNLRDCIEGTDLTSSLFGVVASMLRQGFDRLSHPNAFISIPVYVLIEFKRFFVIFSRDLYSLAS